MIADGARLGVERTRLSDSDLDQNKAQRCDGANHKHSERRCDWSVVVMWLTRLIVLLFGRKRAFTSLASYVGGMTHLMPNAGDLVLRRAETRAVHVDGNVHRARHASGDPGLARVCSTCPT